MCCALFGGGEEAAGTMTSGGTESIIMAVKTHRDYGADGGSHRTYAMLSYSLVHESASAAAAAAPDS